MFDTGDMAPDIAGNALHGAHSKDRIAPGTANTPATANSADIANTADSENPSMGYSRRDMAALGDRPREANPKVQLPTKSLSSDCPPPKVRVLAPINPKYSPCSRSKISEKKVPGFLG
jgi:hypothetical protein